MNRKINSELKHTGETYDKIEEQYTAIDSRLSDESKQLMAYLDTLPKFEKQIFILYTEYASYRKVGDEADVSKDTVGKIINKIKKDSRERIYI